MTNLNNYAKTRIGWIRVNDLINMNRYQFDNYSYATMEDGNIGYKNIDTGNVKNAVDTAHDIAEILGIGVIPFKDGEGWSIEDAINPTIVSKV